MSSFPIPDSSPTSACMCASTCIRNGWVAMLAAKVSRCHTRGESGPEDVTSGDEYVQEWG